MEWVRDNTWGCPKKNRRLLPCSECTCHHAEATTQPPGLCGSGGWLPCMSCQPGCGYFERFVAGQQAAYTGRWQDGALFHPDGWLYVDPLARPAVAEEVIEAALNEQQEEVASFLHGPCLVLAGAGSGKTRSLMVRIERLLEHAASKEICVITFTKKAAGEIRQRVEARMGPRAKGIVLTTFHSLALGICREHPELTMRGRGFSVWDDGQQRTEFRRIYRELWAEANPAAPKDLPFGVEAVLDLVGALKREGRPIDDVFRQWIATATHPICAVAYSEYEAIKVAANAMDFDDLIWAAVRILEGHPQVLDSYRERWPFLLVDEYQDTNDLQEKMLSLIGGEQPNLMVVGDEDQAIFSFQGANVQHILRFTERYPGATVIELGCNYRSTPQILASADRLIRNNVHRRTKKLWTDNDPGGPVEYLTFNDCYHEASYIAKMIESSIESGVQPEQHAVLLRTRRQMAPIQHALSSLNIAYTTVGAIDFWARADVKLILFWLKTVTNPLDISAGAAIMAKWPKLGAKTIERWKVLVGGSSSGEPVFNYLDALLMEKGHGPNTQKGHQISRLRWYQSELVAYCRRGAGVAGLVEWLYKVTGLDEEIEEACNGTGVIAEEGVRRRQLRTDFLALCPDHQELDMGYSPYDQLQSFLDAAMANANREDDEPKVVVSTIHSAKGLEWHSVWVPGMVEGKLPYARGVEGKAADLPGEALEEERRLAYVALTRARSRLVVSRYKRDRDGDRDIFVQTSRFWAESMGRQPTEEQGHEATC